MKAIVEFAAPKVNLTLRVLGKRADGFHELESLVAFARDASDSVTLDPGPARSVAAHGPFAAGIAGENLIAVALDHVARAAPDLILGAITLEKNLPIAAGIGGGSADAAAVLRAIQRANPGRAGAVDWHAIAARIGADVPVCLASRGQLMTGIGEILVGMPDLPALAAVLVNPLAPVPAGKTAQVFRGLAAKPLPQPAPARVTPATFAGRAALLTHMAAIGNDLYRPALSVVPEIDDVLGALRASHRCEHAQLSGGGPTCFGVFPAMDEATAAADRIRAFNPRWWVCATRLT